jgi:hypothetical protein
VNCFERLNLAARKFADVLSKDATVVPTEEYPWKNEVWTSDVFRRAHVEEFVSPAICVLHVVIYPHMNDPAPIYGFDVVTGMKKPAGCYVDLSPSVQDWKNWRGFVTLPSDVPANKKLPEWSTVFSEDFIAIPPRDEEHMEEMFDYGLRLLDFYLKKIKQETVDSRSVYDAHKHYSTMQRNNAKTRQILSRMIGAERADQFMSTVLFPDPPELT